MKLWKSGQHEQLSHPELRLRTGECLRPKNTFEPLNPLNVSFIFVLCIFIYFFPHRDSTELFSHWPWQVKWGTRTSLFEAKKWSCHRHFSKCRVSFSTQKMKEDFWFGYVCAWVFNKSACSPLSDSTLACSLINCHVFRFMIIKHYETPRRSCVVSSWLTI